MQPRVGSKAEVATVLGLLTLHVLLVGWSAVRNSTTWDEIKWLPAGISHWLLNDFELSRVNPPLVRMVAALPVLLAEPQLDWSDYPKNDSEDTDPAVGIRFLELNKYRSFWLLTMARWMCLPFCVLGGYVCYRWAKDLYGSWGGLLALTLWTFCPNVIAHGQLITSDAHAASCGILAHYLFWCWLRRPVWSTVGLAGVSLGMAELTKTTWVILFLLWPALWAVWRFGRSRSSHPSAGRPGIIQLCFILGLAIYVINIGYGFDGSGRPLGDFQFASRNLKGSDGEEHVPGSNRFAGTMLARVPVPLPEDYVYGIDLTKLVFEQKLNSYLRGEWRIGGWWYYYLYALAIKVPLGTWCLCALACCAAARAKGLFLDEFILLAPLLIVLTFVSSQTGFNHHLRYVLPIFPFAFVWIGRTALVGNRWGKVASYAAVAALVWSISSSLAVYPHTLSYFNESIGGPHNGARHLSDSNIDWGQDLLFLRRWLDQHREVQTPVGMSYFIPWLNPQLAGVEWKAIPPGLDASEANRWGLPPEQLGPQPGWYVLSVTHLYDDSQKYRYFLQTTPITTVGYSMRVYHVQLDEANRIRARYGLPTLVQEVRHDPPIAQ